MDFWRNVQAAAEKAASAAKDLGKKGLEAVEATAEEASKKLNLNLHEKVGAGPPKQEPPSQAELAAFGLTPAFAEFVRSLNFSTFRDFPSAHLLPASSGSADAASNTYQLNAWQVRHAMLVVQALKEVNELRFVLCPKYMTDEHFWHVYFTLSRDHLPDKAFSWTASEPLPSFGKEQQQEDGFSLAGLSTQLARLGSQLHSATAAVRPPGLELTSFGGSSSTHGSSAQPAASAPVGSETAAVGAAGAQVPSQTSNVLEEDPDLEAYLQVAINDGQAASQGEEGSGYELGADGDDEDLDLDSYLNELTEAVEAAGRADAAESAATDGNTDKNA